MLLSFLLPSVEYILSLINSKLIRPSKGKLPYIVVNMQDVDILVSKLKILLNSNVQLWTKSHGKIMKPPYHSYLS